MFVKIPSIKENVSVVESFIENVGEKIKIEESIYGNVLVSVTEAVNNAIVHGNKEDKTKKVRLGLKKNKKVFGLLLKMKEWVSTTTTYPTQQAPKTLTK